MFKYILIILLSFQVTKQQGEEIEKIHKLIILKTIPNEPSLDKQNIQLILVPKKLNRGQDDFMLVFTARFPIRTFLEVDDYFTFTFALKNFCAECVGNNLVKILQGDIIKDVIKIEYSYEILATNVFVEILNIDFFSSFSDISISTVNSYLLLTQVNNLMTGSIILFKVINSDLDTIFQVVRVKFEAEKAVSFDKGKEFFFINNAWKTPMKNGESYSTIILDKGQIKFTLIELNICFYLHEEEQDCFIYY